MIAMSFRTFTTKVLVFILSNLLSTKIRGRHSTTEVPRKLYQTFVFSTMEIDNKIVNLENTLACCQKQYFNLQFVEIFFYNMMVKLFW